MKLLAILALLLLSACVSSGPEGYQDYCQRHPNRVECGGNEALVMPSVDSAGMR